MQNPQLDFSPEEKKDLQRAQFFESLKLSPAWALLTKEMDRLVEEALMDMQSLPSDASPEKIKSLHMRWQQRGLMRDSITQFVEVMTELKKEIISRGTEEEHGNDIPATDFTHESAYES